MAAAGPERLPALSRKWRAAGPLCLAPEGALWCQSSSGGAEPRRAVGELAGKIGKNPELPDFVCLALEVIQTRAGRCGLRPGQSPRGLAGCVPVPSSLRPLSGLCRLRPQGSAFPGARPSPGSTLPGLDLPQGSTFPGLDLFPSSTFPELGAAGSAAAGSAVAKRSALCLWPFPSLCPRQRPALPARPASA